MSSEFNLLNFTDNSGKIVKITFEESSSRIGIGVSYADSGDRFDDDGVMEGDLILTDGGLTISDLEVAKKNIDWMIDWMRSGYSDGKNVRHD